MAARREPGGVRALAPGDWAVLALVAERPAHGWAIAAQLARGGEVGSIWSLGRPLVYQALARLEEQGLIRTRGLERGRRGPHRVVYEETPGGRKAVRDWLAAPVEHVREIRSLFLLKVVLSQRAGIDIEPLLTEQRRTMMPFLVWLETQVDDAGSTAELTTLRFRLETTQMVVRFIDGMLDEAAAAAGPSPAAAARPARSGSADRSG
jgi:DNA-binding PadR family transcriptional regulator